MSNNEKVEAVNKDKYIPVIQQINSQRGKKIASVNDSISFSRKGQVICGSVTLVREVSVLVEISPTDALYLQIDSNVTVVNHKNYSILVANACI